MHFYLLLFIFVYLFLFANKNMKNTPLKNILVKN